VSAPETLPDSERPPADVPSPPAPRRWLRRASLDAEAVSAPVAMVALFIALSLASPYFLTQENIINVGTQMAILAIVSFGVTLVMIAGAFDLSVGSQVALHGCVAAIVMSSTGSIILGVLAGLAGGCVFGLVNGLLTTRLSINPFIVTLGTLEVGRGMALAFTSARPVTGVAESITSFGTGRPLGIPWLVWLMIAAFFVAGYLLHSTQFGLRLYAVGGNREAARLSGIRVDRCLVLAFMLSGLFAAIAGIATTARFGAGLPTTGDSLELFAVAAVVLGGSSLYGGRGAMWRTLVGVIIITIIQNGLVLLNVSSPVQMIVIGGVFILAASSELLRVTAEKSRARQHRRLQRGDAGPNDTTKQPKGGIDVGSRN
jgi:ribose transport system permease protein